MKGCALADGKLRPCRDVIGVMRDLLAIDIIAYVHKPGPTSIDEHGSPTPCGGIGPVRTAVIRHIAVGIS